METILALQQKLTSTVLIYALEGKANQKRKMNGTHGLGTLQAPASNVSSSLGISAVSHHWFILLKCIVTLECKDVFKFIEGFTFINLDKHWN